RASAREGEALAAQAEFLTNVTHELKTPLAAIRLLAEMLAEGRAVGREAEYQAMLVAETARLSALIENVLDLRKAERATAPLARTPVDAAAVVRDTVAMLAPLAEQAGHRLTADLPPLPAARGDRGVLAQALVAVLDNARKYAPGPVEITAQAKPRQIEIAVRDHGQGVPAAERERIFERFVRGSAQQHGSVPGVGVGLHLARTLLRRSGGDLRCASAEPGPGAVFLLTLPREDAS
ncbi:MAG: HAMP domain-containing histidine kinase, partial [Planctomycetes bacterium]|nr:HAMP domain-containing histidine kinase [Planctomycetota bacterium]